jgi:hypothetical protein
MICITLALGVASFVYWLSSEFRPDGILGILQVYLQPTVFIPYIAGAIFGSNPHNPDSLTFFITLFIQFYVIAIVLRLVFKKIKQK